MKKITIIGFFAFNSDYNGGQENKTRALGDLLKEKYGNDNIDTIDTLNWKTHPFKLFSKIIKSIKKSDSIIMLPAQNGVKVFSKILFHFKKRNSKIFYSVIGGWLPNITKENHQLRNTLKKFDGIWVETPSMKDELINQGFTNITVVPNFKKLEPISIELINKKYSYPLKLCTFSRVLKEKGIEDAIKAVEEVNKEKNKVIYELDIYGKVDENYIETFNILKNKFPLYVNYKGVIPYNDSVSVLKNYFALLFPTHYYTEGIPGTIIDAYASGLPVISAKWKGFDDIILDKVTGQGYEFNNYNEFKNILLKISDKPTLILDMKEKCLQEYYKYTEEYVFNIINSYI